MAFIILIEEKTFQQRPATCEEGTPLSLNKVLDPVLGLNTVQNNTSSTNRSSKTPTQGRDHSKDKGPEAGLTWQLGVSEEQEESKCDCYT